MKSHPGIWKAVRFNGESFPVFGPSMGDAERRAQVIARHRYNEDDIQHVERYPEGEQPTAE